MIAEVYAFARQPRYKADPELDIFYRFGIFSQLLFWKLLISVAFGILISVLIHWRILQPGENKVPQLLEEASIWFLFLSIVLLVPLLEEVLFRGPLWFFRNSRWFPLVFYFLTVSFGLVHLWNYSEFERQWWLAPVLVAPQLNAGVFLGFIRVRFGLGWSVALHAAYNLMLIGPFMLVRFFTPLAE